MARNETREAEKPLASEAAPGTSYYTPLTDPSPGTALPASDWPQNKTLPLAFTSLRIRDVEFKNRLWVSPMCQYSCQSGSGLHTPWHLVHLGGLARGGAGLVVVEATSVLPNGMISPEDSGIWSDDHIAPLKQSVEFAHTQGAKIGIQLAHAGRKASTYQPWLTDGLVQPKIPVPESRIVPDVSLGWRSKVVGPSAVPYDERHATPVEMTENDISDMINAWAAAAGRAVKAGFDLIEVHGAHGYGIHNFYSPVSNKRTDKWGGSFENRVRLALDIVRAVRAKMPAGMPLFFRVSATDWHEDGEKDAHGNYISWGIEQTIELTRLLQKEGVDLIDVSSGGNYSGQQIPVGPSYQVFAAAAIKKTIPSMLVGTVGLLTSAKQIENHLQNGDADAAFLARQFLRDSAFPIQAAYELGTVVATPVQYQRAHTRMYKRA